MRHEADDSSAGNVEDDCKLEVDQPRSLAIGGDGEATETKTSTRQNA